VNIKGIDANYTYRLTENDVILSILQKNLFMFDPKLYIQKIKLTSYKTDVSPLKKELTDIIEKALK